LRESKAADEIPPIVTYVSLARHGCRYEKRPVAENGAGWLPGSAELHFAAQ